jgi:hypothetical protein
MGDLFQPWHLVVLFFAIIFFIPYWQIFKKAGFAPALSLLMWVPLVNLILLYYVAFSDWKNNASNIAPV